MSYTLHNTVSVGLVGNIAPQQFTTEIASAKDDLDAVTLGARLIARSKFGQQDFGQFEVHLHDSEGQPKTTAHAFVYRPDLSDTRIVIEVCQEGTLVASEVVRVPGL